MKQDRQGNVKESHERCAQGLAACFRSQHYITQLAMLALLTNRTSGLVMS
jgi:hypothetical protein